MTEIFTFRHGGQSERETVTIARAGALADERPTSLDFAPVDFRVPGAPAGQDDDDFARWMAAA